MPPLADSCAEYGLPAMPSGNEEVRIASVAAIVIVNELVVFRKPESTTWTVKVKLPAALGVPMIAPVLAFRVKEVGRLPTVMLQV